MRTRTSFRADEYAKTEYAELLKRIAVNLRRIRTQRGLTQEACAECCGEMPPPVFQSIEAGRANPTTATLARLCKGLDVDVNELFAKVTEPVPPRKSGRPRKTPKE